MHRGLFRFTIRDGNTALGERTWGLAMVTRHQQKGQPKVKMVSNLT